MTSENRDGLPLFERATRRAMLQRGLSAAGLLAAAAWRAACGNDDSNSFATTAATTATTTKGSSSSTSAAGSTRSTQASGGATASAAAVTVAFAYHAADTSGRVRNPYIAVWVEDASSTVVGVVSVWYSSRDSKYLRELTEYTAATTSVPSGEIDAVSGATRSAGDYHVQWDGIGLDGTALSGQYTMWIEAAREHGPHSVTSGPVTLGTPGTATIPANGELSAATVTVG